MSFSLIKIAKKINHTYTRNKAVLSILLEHAGEETRIAWPNQETITNRTGGSINTTKRSLNDLRKQGFVISWTEPNDEGMEHNVYGFKITEFGVIQHNKKIKQWKKYLRQHENSKISFNEFSKNISQYLPETPSNLDENPSHLDENPSNLDENPSNLASKHITDHISEQIKEQITEKFDFFWLGYDKPIEKELIPCKKFFNKLSTDDQDCALLGMKHIVKGREERRFRPNPLRFIKERMWEDYIVDQDQTDTDSGESIKIFLLAAAAFHEAFPNEPRIKESFRFRLKGIKELLEYAPSLKQKEFWEDYFNDPIIKNRVNKDELFNFDSLISMHIFKGFIERRTPHVKTK